MPEKPNFESALKRMTTEWAPQIESEKGASKMDQLKLLADLTIVYQLKAESAQNPIEKKKLEQKHLDIMREYEKLKEQIEFPDIKGEWEQHLQGLKELINYQKGRGYFDKAKKNIRTYNSFRDIYIKTGAIEPKRFPKITESF